MKYITYNYFETAKPTTPLVYGSRVCQVWSDVNSELFNSFHICAHHFNIHADQTRTNYKANRTVSVVIGRTPLPLYLDILKIEKIINLS